MNKEKQIKSPMPTFASEYAKDRGKESGEHIEILLFGDYESKMTLQQILFILDVKNYSCEHTKFRNNFEKVNHNALLYMSSKELKNILDKLEIKIDYTDLQSKQTFKVGYHLKGEEIIEFPPHHAKEE